MYQKLYFIFVCKLKFLIIYSKVKFSTEKKLKHITCSQQIKPIFSTTQRIRYKPTKDLRNRTNTVKYKVKNACSRSSGHSKFFSFFKELHWILLLSRIARWLSMIIDRRSLITAVLHVKQYCDYRYRERYNLLSESCNLLCSVRPSTKSARNRLPSVNFDRNVNRTIHNGYII